MAFVLFKRTGILLVFICEGKTILVVTVVLVVPVVVVDFPFVGAVEVTCFLAFGLGDKNKVVLFALGL